MSAALVVIKKAADAIRRPWDVQAAQAQKTWRKITNSTKESAIEAGNSDRTAPA